MTLKISVHPAPADVLDAAYEQLLPEMRALPAERVVRRVNADIPTAVSVALGAQPVLKTFLDAIRAKLPETPLRCITELDTFAYAALHAHMQSLAVPSEPDRLTALMAKAVPLRRDLATDAKAAVNRDLLDANVFMDIPTGQGRLETAQALLALSVLFRSGWDRVRGRTAVTEAELDAAARTAVELLAALGRENHPTTPQPSQEADELRLRAYTLFYNAYDECRRAMHYLRWHEDDASDFAPSFYGPRGPRTRKAETDLPSDDGATGDTNPPGEQKPPR